MPIADFPGRHNWGYDGVLPYAPDAAYGTPDALKALVDAAHGLGLMVMLDVVYNHFGPDGAYLHAYAKDFFREDVKTPWGAAIDFRRPEVRQYFEQNALYWLMEYRFDGLRFDAVHAINDPGFLDEMAAILRAGVEPGRHIHLVLEHEGNAARHLRTGPAAPGFDAQWTDDVHHCLHVLLTGESEGYYEDFQDPIHQLARCMAEGFAYQGEVSPHLTAAARRAVRPPADHRLRDLPAEPRPDRQPRHGRPADHLGQPAGAAGRHCPAAAVAVHPAAVHGRGGGQPDPVPVLHRPQPGAWPNWCVEGGARSSSTSPPSRTRSGASASPTRTPAPPSRRRCRIAPASARSSTPICSPCAGRTWRRASRAAAPPGCAVLSPAALVARWHLGTGGTLRIASIFGAHAVELAAPAGRRVFATPPEAWDDAMAGSLAGRSAVAWIAP